MRLFHLFKPKWKHSDKKVREAAVKKLTDIIILAQIARTDRDSWIRYIAVMNPNITDQKLLLEIANTDKDSLVRESAVSRLTDQELLVQFIKPDNESKIRETAIARLSDQKPLMEIAINDKSDWIRWIAVMNSNLKDQKLLTELAKFDKYTGVREAAVRNPNFKDQNLLVEIFKTDVHVGVRKYAIENPNFTDQELLAEIAKTDKNSEIREIAASKISDQNLLLTFITMNNDPYIVRGAVTGLKSLSPKIADQKIKRLCLKEHCFTIYKNSERHCVRCDYKERCQNHTFSEWEKDDQPDDRDRYTWSRSCKVCDYFEATQYPPGYR
jgi:uncharacterized DUF497 family protein